MKRLNNKKTLLYSLGFLVAVLAGMCLYSHLQLNSLNTSLRFPHTPDGRIARFPLNEKGSFTSIKHSEVFLDLGSAHSFIEPKTLERFVREGLVKKQTPVMFIASDWNGYYHLYTNKVTIDVELPNPDAPDSVTIIPDVELLVSKYTGVNVIGMDVLRHTSMEHIHKLREVRLYHGTNPKGYKPLAKLNINGNRATLSLAVNQEKPIDYRIDCGGRMSRIQIVQPTRCMHSATTDIVADTTSGLSQQNRCQLVLGGRLIHANVVYDDTLRTDDYSVNPLLLMNLDVLIDFPGKTFSTRI